MFALLRSTPLHVRPVLTVTPCYFQVTFYSSTSKYNRRDKKGDDEDGDDKHETITRKNSLPEILGKSWYPPREPPEPIDPALFPHAIEAAPRPLPGVPLQHFVFDDYLIQSIKQRRFLREFFIWRKRWEVPFIRSYKQYVDQHTAEFTAQKRIQRKHTRTLQTQARLRKNQEYRVIQQRRVERFAKLGRSSVPVDIENTLEKTAERGLLNVKNDNDMLQLIGLSLNDLDPSLMQTEHDYNLHVHRVDTDDLLDLPIDKEVHNVTHQDFTVSPVARFAALHDLDLHNTLEKFEQHGLPLRASAAAFHFDLQLDGAAPGKTPQATHEWTKEAIKTIDYEADAIVAAKRANNLQNRIAAAAAATTTTKDENETSTSSVISTLSEIPSFLQLLQNDKSDYGVREENGQIVVNDFNDDRILLNQSSSSSSSSTSSSSSSSDDEKLSTSSSQSIDDDDDDQQYDEQEQEDDDDDDDEDEEEEEDDDSDIGHDVPSLLIKSGMDPKHAYELPNEFYKRFGVPFDTCYSKSQVLVATDKLMNLPHAQLVQKLQEMVERTPYEDAVRPEGIDDFDVEIVRRTYHEPMGSHASTLEERRVVMRIQLEKLDLPFSVKERLIELVGPRYDSKSGVLKLVADQYPNKQENVLHAMGLLRGLLEESFLVHPNYVPFSDLETDPITTAVPIDTPLASIQAPPFTFIEWQERKELADTEETTVDDGVLFEDDIVAEKQLIPFVAIRYSDIEIHNDFDTTQWNTLEQQILRQ